MNLRRQGYRKLGSTVADTAMTQRSLPRSGAVDAKPLGTVEQGLLPRLLCLVFVGLPVLVALWF